MYMKVFAALQLETLWLYDYDNTIIRYDKTTMSTTTSLSNRQRVRAREPVPFWRENEIAVVILEVFNKSVATYVWLNNQ